MSTIPNNQTNVGNSNLNESITSKRPPNYSSINPKRRNYKQQSIDISQAKEKAALENDFATLKQCIVDGSLEKFKDIASNQDTKWYLENNDLDYEIFFQCVLYCRSEFIRTLESMKYSMNPNMLLIEVYEIYIRKRYNETMNDKQSKENTKQLFKSDNLKYLITSSFGIIPMECLLEYYFLLMSHEYDAAIKLLTMPYAEHLRERLNETFIGDENNLIEETLKDSDIVKDVICNALERRLDGIAFEIYSFGEVYLDEKILKCAVFRDCSIFLENVWESSKKFGNLKNYYAPKISFSKYIACMLEEGKFEMASEAIKNWYEAYKEENIFELLVDKNEELAM